MRASTSVAPIPPGEPSPILGPSDHIHDDESLHHDGYDYSTHDEGNWADDDDISESEISTAYGGLPPQRGHSTRLPLRPQPLPHQPQYRPAARRAPDPAPMVDNHDEYGQYGHGYSGGQFGRGGYPRGTPQPQPQQGYGGYYQHGGQMVGYHTNPFGAVSSPSSNGSYYGDPRGGYGNEMVPQYPGGYFQHPGYMQGYGMPPQGMSREPDPEAAAREKQLQAKIAQFEKEKLEKEAAERKKEQDAEAQRRVEEESMRMKQQMELMMEANRAEIARAREDAERAAVARIEAEQKAAAERAKQQAEAVKAAEERVRIQFEAQMRAAEARRQKEEEERAKAEEAAKLRLEAALRADAEMKKLQAKKAAEEAEKLKQIQEDAKRKADAEMLAKIEAEKEKAQKAAEEAEKLKQIQEDAKRKADAEMLAKIAAEKETAQKKAEDEALAKQEREAFKKRVEEETKANLEKEAKKDRGPYIQFKDALGRKYSFPYRLCTTWQNMEDLIKQAFDNVDDLSYHVQEGWYDLIGPNSEIVLPSVWEKLVEPDWSVTMTMWPMDRIRNRFPQAVPGMGGFKHGIPPAPPPLHSKGKRPVSGIPGGVAPPPAWMPPGARGTTNVPPGIQVVSGDKDKKKKKKQPPGLTSFFGVKPPKKSSKK